MPQMIKVKSLYSITLTHVNSTLCSLAKQGECSPELVLWIQSNLHRNIKEDLLAQYNWWHRPYSLRYMIFVIDCTVNKIVLNECLSNRALTGLDYIEFMEYLYGQNIEHLCNLSLHFKKYLIETSKLKQGNYFLCLSLNNGMARNLHTVVLPYVADNSVLKCLGEHCTQLVYLDISNSWNIDEDGIFNLLFKNPEDLNLPVDVISSEMDPPSECLLDELSVPDEELNPTCFTLQEIRIQGTNTSPTNLFIILLAVKNLKSLGGYLYFRSVGDAIVTLNSNNPALRLNLTHLWDAHLPPLKLDTLAHVLPHLSTLSTRVSNLPFKRAHRSSVERYINACLRAPSANPGSNSPTVELPEDKDSVTDPCGEHHWPFRNITHLTLDFDFLYSDHLFRKFLKFNGHSLRKLVLVDQPYNFNLLCIDQHCPLLEELTACVMVPEEAKLLPPMRNLRSAELTVNADRTLLSIFIMFPAVQRLTVHIRLPDNLHENQNGVYDLFFHDISSLQLPCFLSLLELRLHFVSDPPPNPGFGVEEAVKLLELFENLRILGNLDSWGVCMKVKELEAHARSKRWDVALKRHADNSEESTVFNR